MCFTQHWLYLTNGWRSSGTRRSAGLLTGGGMLVRTLSGSAIVSSCVDGSATVSVCGKLCCDCGAVLSSLVWSPPAASSPMSSHCNTYHQHTVDTHAHHAHTVASCTTSRSSTMPAHFSSVTAHASDSAYQQTLCALQIFVMYVSEKLVILDVVSSVCTKPYISASYLVPEASQQMPSVDGAITGLN